MPVKAIEEARKVLELLPYRKASGEALLESAQNGTMSVNYGLDFLDLPEWSLYYAQKALFINPYRNTSHIGVAIGYDQLGEVSSLQGFNEFATPSSSEFLQGLTLNVNSLNFSNRYSTLISKPGHYLTLGSIYAQGDSEEKQFDAVASGDFGSRFPLTYWLYSSYYRDNGYLENSETKEINTELILGYQPNYQHDIFLDVGYDKSTTGVPRVASSWAWFFPSSFWPWGPDDNQEYKENDYFIQLGYHRRFSPLSHLVTDLRYLKSNDNLENRDFERDFSGFADSRGRIENIALGIRHMFTLYEDHQLSYGVDYNLIELKSGEEWPYIYPLWTERIIYSLIRRALAFHLYDRWSISPKITLDAGLVFSYYSPEEGFHSQDNIFGPFDVKIDKNKFNLNPRVGVAVESVIRESSELPIRGDQLRASLGSLRL